MCDVCLRNARRELFGWRRWLEIRTARQTATRDSSGDDADDRFSECKNKRRYVAEHAVACTIAQTAVLYAHDTAADHRCHVNNIAHTARARFYVCDDHQRTLSAHAIRASD